MGYYYEIENKLSVYQAAEEFDTMGEEPFLEKYHCGKDKGWHVKVGWKSYPLKAIFAAAHFLEYPDCGQDIYFHTHSAKRNMSDLGFEMTYIR